MTGSSCGIDFGTSNSTVGIGTPDGARLIALEDGSPTLPSAVFWDADGGAPCSGGPRSPPMSDGTRGD